MICETCGKEFFEDWRRDKYTKLKNPVPRFCSKACANSRKHSEETKKKISRAIRSIQDSAYFERRTESYRKTMKEKRDKALVRLPLDGTVLPNITNKELDEYRKDHPVCEICGKAEVVSTSKRNKKNSLCLDHNHTTGNFRGLLCFSCNSKLGWYQNNKEQIEEYLSKGDWCRG